MLVKKGVNFITTLFIIKTWFSYKQVYSQFATTHYVVAYKTIHMYYLKMSHDSLNRSCD
jgi:hypothetical protein